MHYYSNPDQGKQPFLNNQGYMPSNTTITLNFTESNDTEVYEGIPLQGHPNYNNNGKIDYNQNSQPSFGYPSFQTQQSFNTNSSNHYTHFNQNYGYGMNNNTYGNQNYGNMNNNMNMYNNNNQYMNSNQGNNNYSGGYGNNNSGGSNSQFNYDYTTYHTVFNPEEKVTEDYFNKQIDGGIFKRTELNGTIKGGYTEFDDYFETHVEKFFTPEINDITVFYSPGYVLGMQTVYRDPWGKTDKETYKGKLHLPKGLDPKQLASTKLTFDYDDYIKEIYVDGTEYICYLKIVSNKGKTLEVGSPTFKSDLKNKVPELGRILGFGGAYHLCLNALYFYYL